MRLMKMYYDADADLGLFKGKKVAIVGFGSQGHAQALKPHMGAGKTLLFSHGFNIHFGQIVPDPQVDVIMVAPKGPGHLVRSEYEKGAGVPALVAGQQNPSGKALATALAYARGLGSTRAGRL